jgi:hypothetical protein
MLVSGSAILTRWSRRKIPEVTCRVVEISLNILSHGNHSWISLGGIELHRSNDDLIELIP